MKPLEQRQPPLQVICRHHAQLPTCRTLAIYKNTWQARENLQHSPGARPDVFYAAARRFNKQLMIYAYSLAVDLWRASAPAGEESSGPREQEPCSRPAIQRRRHPQHRPPRVLRRAASPLIAPVIIAVKIGVRPVASLWCGRARTVLENSCAEFCAVTCFSFMRGSHFNAYAGDNSK